MSFLKKKSYGQHFLHERQVIERIVDLVDDINLVVEIGPGEGALTRALQERYDQKGTQMMLVEADRDLFSHLQEMFPGAELIQGDAARVAFDQYVKIPWVCVGNLPYNAAAAIMTHVLQTSPRPRQCVFMIQREQAQRATAAAGDLSMLSLALQLYGTVSQKFHVARGAFVPPPKVESTVIEIRPFPEDNTHDNEGILTFAQHGFLHRRKQLLPSLVRAGYEEQRLRQTFVQLQLEFTVRPQELTVDQWKKLYEFMHKTSTN